MRARMSGCVRTCVRALYKPQSYDIQKHRTESLTQEESEPLRLTDIQTISRIHGNDKLVDRTLVQTCTRYGLMQWPRNDSAAVKAETWKVCLEQSPALRQRLVSTEECELRKMFGVGSLTNSEALMPEQVIHKHKHPNTLTHPITHSLNTGACHWVHAA